MAGLTKQQREDKALIEQNPDATPDELLNLGLSPDGYAKLMADLEQKNAHQEKEESKPAPVKPEVVEKNEPKRAVPQLREYKPAAPDGMVLVEFPNGTAQYWPRKTAERYKRGGRNANVKIVE